jgi:hypothetical protein
VAGGRSRRLFSFEVSPFGAGRRDCWPRRPASVMGPGWGERDPAGPLPAPCRGALLGPPELPARVERTPPAVGEGLGVAPRVSARPCGCGTSPIVPLGRSGRPPTTTPREGTRRPNGGPAWPFMRPAMLFVPDGDPVGARPGAGSPPTTTPLGSAPVGLPVDGATGRPPTMPWGALPIDGRQGPETGVPLPPDSGDCPVAAGCPDSVAREPAAPARGDVDPPTALTAAVERDTALVGDCTEGAPPLLPSTGENVPEGRGDSRRTGSAAGTLTTVSPGVGGCSGTVVTLSMPIPAGDRESLGACAEAAGVLPACSW